jgi:hypothetical protein
MRATVATALLAALALGGCLSSRQSLVRALRPTSVAVVVLRDVEGTREVVEVPSALANRIATELDARNLKARNLDPARWAGELANRRTTAHRLAWLAQSTEAELVLLVETRAAFYSALNGRFRWTVDAKATLARRATPDDATTSTFELPAFLDFEHEKENRALEVSAPVVAEKIGALADSVLGTLAEPGGK